jgi:hypothetical protein
VVVYEWKDIQWIHYIIGIVDQMASSVHVIKNVDSIKNRRLRVMPYRKSIMMTIGGTGPTYWNGADGLKIPESSGGVRACRVCE